MQREIRLLPMSKKQEFPNMSYEQIQQHFFRKELVARRGYYYFRKDGLTALKKSVRLGYQITILLQNGFRVYTKYFRGEKGLK